MQGDPAFKPVMKSVRFPTSVRPTLGSLGMAGVGQCSPRALLCAPEKGPSGETKGKEGKPSMGGISQVRTSFLQDSEALGRVAQPQSRLLSATSEQERRELLSPALAQPGPFLSAVTWSTEVSSGAVPWNDFWPGFSCCHSVVLTPHTTSSFGTSCTCSLHPGDLGPSRTSSAPRL